jgi:hypothetical protein
MPLEEQAALDAARNELGNCVLNSSWVYCTGAPRASRHSRTKPPSPSPAAASAPRPLSASPRAAAAAVLLSVPVGVRLKRLTPLVRAALAHKALRSRQPLTRALLRAGAPAAR